MGKKLTKTTDSWKYAQALYFTLGFLACLYLYLVHRTSLADGLHANRGAQLIIGLTIAVPEVVIWIIAARGTIRFKEYAQSIRDSKDGAALNLIANALIIWLAYVVTITIAYSTLSLVHGRHALKMAVTASDHLPLLISLAASFTFFWGARQLNRLAPLRISKVHARGLWALALVLSAGFTAYFYHFEPQLREQDNVPRFALPVATLLFTYVLPHLVTWGMGAYACISLRNYAHRVKGAIYKDLFRTLARGVMLVFVCTFLAQVITVSHISMSKFNPWLLAVYALLLLGVYGFVLIYRGASNLHGIEKV